MDTNSWLQNPLHRTWHNLLINFAPASAPNCWQRNRKTNQNVKKKKSLLAPILWRKRK